MSGSSISSSIGLNASVEAQPHDVHSLHFFPFTHVGFGKGHEHVYTRGVWIYTRVGFRDMGHEHIYTCVGLREGHGTRACLHT